jgi:hypothetical protein
MNDPHVVSLLYKVTFGKDVDYDKAPPLKEETEYFVCTLDREKAFFEMKTHFPKEEEAKKIADDFLKTCTIYWGLQNYLNEISFLYGGAEIVDRRPGQSNALSICVGDTICLSDEVASHVSRAVFPPAPHDFVVSPDVETIYNRYNGYVDSREKLTSMAYFCLTVLEEGRGRKVRKEVEKKYQIDLAVLNKWGDLVSERGSEAEARKANKDKAFTPLRDKEQEWLIALIKKVIIRLGNYAYDSTQSFPKITFNDLPNLS